MKRRSKTDVALTISLMPFMLVGYAAQFVWWGLFSGWLGSHSTMMEWANKRMNEEEEQP